jgi:hypothetical protein
MSIKSNLTRRCHAICAKHLLRSLSSWRRIEPSSNEMFIAIEVVVCVRHGPNVAGPNKQRVDSLQASDGGRHSFRSEWNPAFVDFNHFACSSVVWRFFGQCLKRLLDKAKTIDDCQITIDDCQITILVTCVIRTKISRNSRTLISRSS